MNLYVMVPPALYSNRQVEKLYTCDIQAIFGSFNMSDDEAYCKF